MADKDDRGIMISSENSRVVHVDGVTLVCHVFGEGPVRVAHPGGPGGGWEYLRMPLLGRFMTMLYVEPAGNRAECSPLTKQFGVC
jgi:proline iminopeptidase